MDTNKFINWRLENDSLVKAIAERANEVHENVNQHYDKHPYFYHLNMVFEELLIMDSFGVLSRYYYDENLFKVLTFSAYFHDTIEDARLTYNDVKQIAIELLGDEEVATMSTEVVYALTNEKGRTREERANDKYYAGIRNTICAPTIKAADRCANIRYSCISGSKMFDVYRQEMPHFVKMICDKNEILSHYLLGTKSTTELKQ